MAEAPIENALAGVKDFLRSRFADWHAAFGFTTVDFDEFAGFIQGGGKWLRPRLLLLVHCACGGRFDERVREVAASLELVHANSLLYDDIQDNALTRRGAPAQHITYGISATMGLCSVVGRLAIHLIVASRALRPEEKDALLGIFFVRLIEMSAGQLEELTLVRDGRLDLTEEACVRIIRGKTASLFRFACESGAFLARPADESLRAKFSSFGLRLGTLFQLADDDQDVFGVGPADKPRRQDIRESKRTLLFIFARDRLDSRRRAQLDEIYAAERRTDSEIAQVAAWMEESGARKAVLERIREEDDGARRILDEIGRDLGGRPDSGEVIALRDFLAGLVAGRGL